MRATRIIATVGPACATPDAIAALTTAGADAFRINCSHIDTAQIAGTVATIRAGVPDATIILDVQGPKLRTGRRPLTFTVGQRTVLRAADLDFDPVVAGIRVGHQIVVDDGRVRLVAAVVDDDGVHVDVLVGGDCLPRRGVNLPDSDTGAGDGVLSDKDVADIAAGRAAGVDWVALSFVGSAGDVDRARAVTGPVPIIAKIERRAALDRLDAIAGAADALMAARGDLGVEIPFEDVPGAQLDIARAAHLAGKPSICATEMLESMRTGPRPTRAEVADVAEAARQGFDAVMLSAETATGVDPVNCVAAMAVICRRNEHRDGNKAYADTHPDAAAVPAAAAALAVRTGASAILAMTATGRSAEILAACRPPAPIIAATADPAVARRLGLYRGIRTVTVARPAPIDDAVAAAVDAAVDAGLLTGQDTVVVTASRSTADRPADTIWLNQPPR